MMCAAVAGRRAAARPADRALRQARREDPHFRRRALQLHQSSTPSRRTTCRKIRISAGLRCRGIRRATLSSWSNATASPGTRKTLGQLFCDRDRARHHRAVENRVRSRRRAVAHAVRGARRRARRRCLQRCRPPMGPVSGEALVIATGGLTVPKDRRDAVRLSHRRAVRASRSCRRGPALVPLAFDSAALARYGDLSGISVDAEVCCNHGRFRDALLFTHRGLSGPAILQISSYWNGGDALSIDLLPGSDAHAWLESERRVDGATGQHPRGAACRARFAQQWSGRTALPCRGRSAPRRQAPTSSWQACSMPGRCCRRARSATTRPKSRWVASIRARCHRGRWQRERCRGLHFIGEVVDVTGWLGGYNFQWAWSSGCAAGQHA